MQEESRGNKYINNFKVFVSLPIICKKNYDITKRIKEIIEFKKIMKNLRLLKLIIKLLQLKMIY